MDIFVSFVGILVLSPVFIVLAILVKIGSAGPVIYKQNRVGLRNMDFSIYKFRTMYLDSDKKGLITIGDRDPRVTSIGYYLRKLKLDEIPQLFNVLFGHMSLVGPRPEVRKYVDYYSKQDIEVLNVRPGITDYASIEFRNENEMLKDAVNPDKKYIEEILPIKLSLNKKYIREKSFLTDIKILCLTMVSIFGTKK
ncbi:sugar transferase [Flagellimonas sp. S3867]|uniref:sugar transferase n=1 Tax=Flagellimonas sp. S3867 TaxID=2768063 RepID=UPI001CC229C9|nr:sugar transferase [Flagellimonas sp. S3867]